MKDYEIDEEKSKKKRIIIIIILIILLLLLITSCTSRFWGKIGDLFRNEGNYEIDNGTNDQNVIINQELKFERDSIEIRLSDIKPKLGFYYQHISPEEFSCSTSDAEIATCYVVDGYVVINPKKAGEVLITLQTNTNGKIYQATSKVTILDANKYISLSSTSGSINLNYTNQKLFSYHLVGIRGEVSISSSDPTIATATLENGVVRITAYKVGTVKITLQVVENGITYTGVYTLNITKSGNVKPSIPNNGSTNPGNPSKPSNPENPSEIEKDSNSLLKQLTISSGTLKFQPNVFQYVVGVPNDVSSVSLKAIASSSKAHVSYYYQGKKVDSLNDLNLNVGNNDVLIVVTAEDGSISTYQVTINRGTKSDNTLANLQVSEGVLSPKFSKDQLFYEVEVSENTDKITIDATLSNPNSSIEYIYNGKVVNDLKDLPLKPGDNQVTIVVTGEDGVKRTYTVVVHKKLSDNNYLSDIVTDHKLNETFKKDKNDYTMTVPENIDTVNLNPILEDSRSKLTYKLNGKPIDSLENLKLVDGDNKLEIIVTSESGKENTYSVLIHKDSSNNNYLSNITSKYPLNETFQKEKNDYTMNVPFDTEKLTIDAPLEDSRSKVTYKVNGQVVDSLENINLNPGDNKVEIIVTSPSGKENTYSVSIHRPIREIVMVNDSHTIKLDNIPYRVDYKILEDGEEISNYDIKDISVSMNNYKGTYEIKEGHILVTPDYSMSGKTAQMVVQYYKDTANTNLKFELGDYYLNSYANEYDVILENGVGTKNILLNTNLFLDDVVITNLPNGIRITSSKNSSIYVDITTSNKNVTISSSMAQGSSTIVVKTTATSAGTANIHISGSAFGQTINEFDVKLNIIEKFNIVIDANGGFFDEFTTKYQFKLTAKDTIDLGEYVAYKIDETGNCMYYKLVSYNTKSDGSGISYDMNKVLSDFKEDLTLYAIYSSTSEYIELEENKKLYLTDVDLFHNEEYFELYNEDKVVYPTAKGSYVMTFDNNSADEVIITGITLEEDTICIPNKGCLNMGYIIKYAPKTATNYTYAYGSSTSYSILNKDANTLKVGNHTKREIEFAPNDYITIPKGEGAEISLLWEWVSVDDELDTLIGNEAANLNDRYLLTVSIDFKTKNTHCVTN